MARPRPAAAAEPSARGRGNAVTWSVRPRASIEDISLVSTKRFSGTAAVVREKRMAISMLKRMLFHPISFTGT